MKKMNTDYTERLRAVIRLVSHGNQASFARLCHIPASSLTRLLKGQYRMTDLYASKICSKVEGLNPDFLFGLSDDMGDIVTGTHRDRDQQLEDAKKRISELEGELASLKWLIRKAMIEER